MANNMGVPVDKVASAGVGLAFVVFPQIINELPMSPLFGVLFFLSLTVAGITSLISLAEVCFAAVSEKFSLSRQKQLELWGRFSYSFLSFCDTWRAYVPRCCGLLR